MPRDTLFLLAAPFEDEGEHWYCHDCAALEGALLANPHWAELIEVRRVEFPRPREEVVALLGEDQQDLPVLVLAPDGAPPPEAALAQGRAFLKQPKTIARYLALTYGGAGPHP